jgi:putative ABC transport system permease protein
VSRGERLYRALLRLYPPTFRREYGQDLMQGFRDRRAEARHRGAGGRGRLGMLIVGDLLRSVPLQWWRAVRGAAARPGFARWDAISDDERREGGTGMGWIAQDVAFATRSWTRRPGYAAAAVLTLAVGIAGATTMFGVLDRVVLRPLPYDDPGRLVQVGSRYERMEGYLGSVSPGELHRWRQALETMDVAGSRLQLLTLRGTGDPEILSGAGVSGSFFDVLGVGAARGRLFGDAEDRPEAAPVAVLTWGTWQRRFGGDPSVLGRTVALDDIPFTVVGVLPRDYVPPEALYHGDVEVYFPLQHVADDVGPNVVQDAFLQALARVAPGVGLDAAREELRTVEAELLEEYAGAASDRRSVDLVPLHARTVGDFGRTLLPFLGAVGMLLLVACANVANLSLVRATERGREMAVRTALGAGRGRLVRQLLTESVLLSGAAGALGAALAWGAVEAFRRLSPEGIPRAVEVTVDPRVLGFALGLALLTGLVFGLAPVLHVVRAEVAPSLGERGFEGPSRTGRADRVRSALVAGEVALALVLVVGAGLLVRSLVGLVSTDLGFEPARMAYMTVVPEGDRWEGSEARLRLFRALHERLSGRPGVVAVGGTSNLPLSGNESVRNVSVEGFEAGGEEGEDVSYNRVLPGFFPAAGVPLVEGRGFDWSDGGTGTIPVVVNRAMARRFWPSGGALGGRLHYGSRDSGNPWMQVVGVVGDVRQLAPGRPPVPQLYVPFAAFATGVQTMVVRTGGDAGEGAQALRQALREVAPGLAVRRVGTMRGLLADSVVRPRFFTLILGTFAAISVLLAVVGVYGTMAYGVRQRTRELGVRMALGADRGRVRRMVLRRGLGWTAVGLALGLGLALASTRLLEGLVYGVTPTDPATLAGAALTLATAAALAAWIPAARATRIDPSRALRSE